MTSVAHGATTVVDPAAGTQAVSSCSEPKMAKLPRKKQVGSKVVVKASGVTVGTQWLLRIDGHDWAAGNADSDKIRFEGQLSDFGLRPRKLDVELVLANEACENSPWKLTRKIGYAGRFNGALTDPNAPEQPATQTPAQDTTGKGAIPGAATPAVPKLVIPKPVKPKKIEPLTVPTEGRIWVTPTDVTAHSTDQPKNPKLPRAELTVDAAQSTNALVGLGILFIAISIAVGLGLVFLNRKDMAGDVAAEEGRLPSHLDTSDMGNLSLSAAGAEVVKQGPVPVSLFSADATAPVLAEEAPEQETPTEAIPGHVEPDHIASEPGDVPVPVAGAEHSYAPVPPPVESLGDEYNVNSFLEERAPTEEEVPSAAEPHHTAESAGALHAAAAAADRDNAAMAANPANGQAPDQNGSPEGFDKIVAAMLDDGALQQELRGIVAEARDDAARAGVPVDHDAIINELDRVTSAANLSGPARDKLMERFDEIVSEELLRVPQAQ
jgi:hypothetical protein